MNKLSLREKYWTRREYKTWDEAFRGLAPAVRQQSVRVAAYTQALYVQACKTPFGTGDDYSERIRGQYTDLAYKCGLYHQLGKALVPHEYQIEQADFTDEERAVYRKYTTDGSQLIASLMERTGGAKERRSGRRLERKVQNIPQLMLQESCRQHMERWDGSGFPEGCKGGQISPIARLVGLARELDRLSAQTKSEDPFEEAYAALNAASGTLWQSELIDILNKARPVCREVYDKYIYYTLTLPKSVPLVVKRPERPFGLTFRPMVADGEGTVAAYEANLWFRLTTDEAAEKLTAAEQQDLIHRAGLAGELMNYFFYEAADALYRMQNCKLETAGILLEVLPDFYKQGSHVQMLNKLFEDQPVPREKLMLTIPEETVLQANKAVTEVITRYLRNGIVLVVDNYHPDSLSAQRLKDMGFTHLRVAPELYLQQATANAMYELKNLGFTLIGGGADTQDLLAWQIAAGAAFTGGTMTGIPVTEDELIRDALLKERVGHGN